MRPNEALALALGKALIATAWADGYLHPAEQACLEDLLYQLPDLDTQAMEELHALLMRPMEPEISLLLIEHLAWSLKNQTDIDFCLYALEQVAMADGVMSEEEKSLLAAFERNLTHAPKAHSLLNILKAFIRPVQNRRSWQLAQSLPKQGVMEYIQDRIRNLEPWSDLSHLETPVMQRLCLFALLLGRMVWADLRVEPSEIEQVLAQLKTQWQLNEQQSQYMLHLALDPQASGLDLLRLCREYCTRSSLQERQSLLEHLKAIAAADGTISPEETVLLMIVAAHLKIEHDIVEQLLKA
jgi:uncharacterized tellurite resistance protein B-like protein